MTPKEYRGIKWQSDADLSRKLGKCISYVNVYRHMENHMKRL